MKTNKYKRKQCIDHFILRCKERYNLNLSLEDHEYIVNQIQNNENCRFIKKDKKHNSIFMVKIEHKMVPVVYSKRHKILITCLTNNIKV